MHISLPKYVGEVK